MAYHMSGQDEINNREDIIDSREVIARIEYLESERSDLVDALKEAEEPLEEDNITEEMVQEWRETLDAARTALKDWDESDEANELKALQSFAEEAEGYAEDWHHGCTLIRDSYFTEYAEELVKDIGDMPAKIPDYIEIDWERTAENIKVDYTSAEFDGVTYWVR